MIYQLKSDLKNCAFFMELPDVNNSYFMQKYSRWSAVDLNQYVPIEFKLMKSDTNLKNYQFDVSAFSLGIIVLSENAVEKLSDILNKCGQILEIKTPSKKKKFYGFYPNKNMYDNRIINLDKSEYREAEKGKIFNKTVFNQLAPFDDYIFTIKDNPVILFVTEKFKKLVEESGLVGFDFSRTYEIA